LHNALSPPLLLSPSHAKNENITFFMTVNNLNLALCGWPPPHPEPHWSKSSYLRRGRRGHQGHIRSCPLFTTFQKVSMKGPLYSIIALRTNIDEGLLIVVVPIPSCS
jgi:hypothetical protein